MSGSSVSISDMHNFVENLDGPNLNISSNVGNIIELGGEDLGDDLGASLLFNSSSSSRPANSKSHDIPMMEPLNDISIGTLEPLEPISFDVPSSSSAPSMPDISIHRDSSSAFSSSSFSNEQTATGPSITMSSLSRMSPEEERKKKIEMINKLNRLESKGYTLTRHFTMDNSLEEIQEEYDRLADAKNLESSLKFQRGFLINMVSGMEYLNNKFDPFDWELDGWSEAVHENIEDFDEIFEELYDKYKGKGNLMPPEVRLLMTLVTSGVTFHISNSFFRSKMSNMDPSDIFKNNPQLAKQFAAAAAQQAGPGFGNFMGAAMGMPQQMQQQMPQQMPMNGSGAFYQSSVANGVSSLPPQVPQSVAASAASSAPRREMKGPSNVDDILKTFQEVRAAEINSIPISMPTPIQTSSFMNQPAVQAAAEIASIHSTPMSDISTDTTRTTGGTAQRRGRRKGVAPPSGNTMTLNL